MYLVQILVPVFDNSGQKFDQGTFDGVRAQLMQRFGGLTAFVQSPAMGLWKDTESGATAHDDMILIEVMVDDLDRDWWTAYRASLEDTFRQQEIVVRAIAFERI